MLTRVKFPRFSPWFLGGLFALAFAVFSLAVVRSPSGDQQQSQVPSPGEGHSKEAPCPAGTLLDQGACIPVPLSPK